MLVVDLDGVFADFSGAAAAIHGKWGTLIEKWNFFEDWEITEAEFWEVIHAAGDDFYKEMVLPYPWAVELLCSVAKTDDFVIMSAPSESSVGYAGKKIWVDKYLQPYVVDKIKLIVGKDKWLLAGDGRLLIAASEKNLKAFRDAGGYAVAFPQLWNSRRKDAAAGNGDCMKFINNKLIEWKDRQGNELQRQSEQRKSDKRWSFPGRGKAGQ